ncbi:MAG: ABC transporter ATP-binding protein [Mycobacteriales bacterium]
MTGITAGYAGTQVLREVDLRVPAGSVVALLGPNGAGKTTTLRVACGLLRPTRGSIVVAGQDLTGWEPHAATKLGICHVPEGRGVFPSLTVRENLALQSPKGREQEALQRAVDTFPVLGRRIDQLAGTMSGGEQQMLALSRAYVQDARLVLLDEVSMGLAPKVVDEIFAFLVALAASGTSLLLVEQYVSKALELSDYVYLLDRGRVAFVGEPAELADQDVFARYLGAEVPA